MIRRITLEAMGDNSIDVLREYGSTHADCRQVGGFIVSARFIPDTEALRAFIRSRLSLFTPTFDNGEFLLRYDVDGTN